jgi:hypothetical protein
MENSTTNKGLKLWGASKIKKQQDKIAKSGTKLLAMIRENANQCLAHFKAHGDITLAERLLASLPPGMVVAGLAKWFKDFAPVKFDVKGKAEVTGKPEETKLEEAMGKDWTQDAEVKSRANRPFTQPNIAYFKGMMSRWASKVDKLNAEAPAGQRMTPEEVAVTKAWINGLVETGNTLTILRTGGDKAEIKPQNPKGESRSAVQRAKKAARDALASEVRPEQAAA